MNHDRLCEISEEPCCPWMGLCECQCTCEFIDEIRADERRLLLTWGSKLAGRNRIWLVRALKRKDMHWNDGVRWTLEALRTKVLVENRLAEQRRKAMAND